jgi:prevent-host-death family protein
MTKVSHRGSEDARKELPSLVEAAEGGHATIITRHGRPVAALIPVDAYYRSHRQQSILPLEGSGHGLWGKDSTHTIRTLRDEWGR